MIESLSKILGALSSRKAATVAVCGCVISGLLLLSTYDPIMKLVTSKEVATTLIALIAICGFGLAFLLTEFLFWITRVGEVLIGDWRAKKAEIEHRKQEIEDRIDHVRDVLPHLPKEHKDLLDALEHQDPQLIPYSNELRTLEKMNAVRQVEDLDGKRALYGLHPDTAEFIRSYLRRERKERFEQTLQGLSESEKQFLTLFAAPGSEDPEEFEHPFMESDLYFGAESLVNKGVLSGQRKNSPRMSLELVTIAEEALEAVQKTIGEPIVRTSIILDRGRIAARGRGGGMTSSNWQ